MELAVNGDAIEHFLPDHAQIVFLLQAVGFAHIIKHIRLDGTLEGAHTHHLHLDTHLVKQFLHVGRYRCQAMQVNGTHRIQEDAVGNAGKVIVGLIDALVAIGSNPLAALLELLESAPHNLQCGRCGAHAITLDVNTIHLVILGSILDGRHEGVQSHAAG